MAERLRFNRMELAGSLGDLGTLLPISIAMVLVNGLNPVGLFFSIGLFYIFTGLYFGITVPVQPMKVIGAYAVAASLSPSQILASSLLMAFFLLLAGMTGAIDLIKKLTPRAVIRGVQLSTGALLMSGGIKFIMGTSKFQELHQAAEPYLTVQSLGPVPIGILIGTLGGLATLLLLDNKKLPAGLAVILGGLAAGWILGARLELPENGPMIHLPEIFPLPFPGKVDFSFALFALVLPQVPMTLGNAALAYTDLSREYFKENSSKVSNRRVCISMALGNILSFVLGGMPMCHGAGGLAAHYRFGARTAGSNLMIGLVFLGLTLGLGDGILSFFNLLPMSILGILLVFAGAQLALAVMDLETRKEFFVAALILGITLASNLAVGFITGMVVAQLLKWKKLSV
ncbi:putative sulfate/molybdate transporter [Desulfospira joergensenii]|uniref:putative sulfate/molybdate transporter n=1 Tax=Desulfospira joergensenii TaxID=53329 RepID=UPI0003B4F9FB|nr:putative sulfate/molybdate transporter [Desulfospira joergensenii]